MQKLPESDPEIYQEFLGGNWIVNNNQNVVFVSWVRIMPLNKQIEQ